MVEIMRVLGKLILFEFGDVNDCESFLFLSTKSMHILECRAAWLAF